MIKIADFDWNPKSERLLADGAWGTSLMQRGLKRGDPPELMNSDMPEVVDALAQEYFGAGSDIILTNSFVGSRTQLERHGLADRTVELNRKAAEIAKQAALGATGRTFSRPLVAGSIGPSGKMLMMGDIESDELFGVFIEQAGALRDGGVDCFLIESMMDLEEMTLAVRAAKEQSDLPIIASVTYEKGNQGYRTIMGNDPKTCADRALQEGACVVGANCGTGIANYMELAKELCAMDLAPVWIKANAGLPEMVDGDTVYRQTPDEYAAFVPELLGVGVSVIGGCCGTTPDFIRAMRREFDSWLSRHERN